MAGIYIHIPFCNKRCSYCDFFSTTDTKSIDYYISILKAEIWMRRNYLHNEIINTIYFGGGTPSLLSKKNIEEILFSINSVFCVDKNAEITLECNPDDLTEKYIKDLKCTQINRLSIGIQSFFDDDLLGMNRRHSSNQAIDAVANAKYFGFDNISIDLIYGLPNMTLERWTKNLEIALSLKVQHISAYHLTFHSNTKWGKNLKKNLIKEVDESESFLQYQKMKNIFEENGFVHYEISNFALPNFYSRHNSSYWKQIKYAGFGPSAHSYNGNMREWNCSDLAKYFKNILNNKIPSTIEVLGKNEKFNEYIITSLRTIWGVDKFKIKNEFGEKFLNHFERIAYNYSITGHTKWNDNCLILTDEGMFISDKIICDFIIID